MPTLSKTICNAAAISRGLDKTNPEYKRKQRKKLATKMQRLIRYIHRLKNIEYESGVTLASCRDIACGLIALLDESEFDRLAIKDVVIDLIQLIDGEA